MIWRSNLQVEDLKPYEYKKLINKVLKQDIKKDQKLSFKDLNESKILFPKSKNLGKGIEVRRFISNILNLTLKKLFIKKGRMGGLQFHERKMSVDI